MDDVEAPDDWAVALRSGSRADVWPEHMRENTKFEEKDEADETQTVYSESEGSSSIMTRAESRNDVRHLREFMHDKEPNAFRFEEEDENDRDGIDVE